MSTSLPEQHAKAAPTESDGGHVEDAPSQPGKARFFSLIIIAVAVGGFVALQALRPTPPPIERPQLAPGVQVVPIEPRSGPIPVTGSGFVVPRAQIDLAAQVSGELVETSAALTAGGRFQAGEVLARIDPRNYETALARAEADLAAARASLAFLEQQITRASTLSESGFASEEVLDQRRAERDRARADVARFEALLADARLNLERTEIRAPFDGQTRADFVDTGSVVQPGQRLAQIFATDRFEVVVALDTDDALLIPGLWAADETGPGSAARVTATIRDTGFAWPARVDRAEAGIDEATRTVDVVVAVDDPMTPGRPVAPAADAGAGPPLLAGSFVSVEIDGADIDNQVVLPRAALRPDNMIWLVSEDDTLRIVRVEVLFNRDETVIIRAGELSAGIAVIVSNLTAPVDGMAVRVLAPVGAS